jgi:RHH-type rel operon transcriptional repressor/antitoxin RelB
MLGIRLEPELEARLGKLAKKTGRSKSFYAREAIRQYLEDREDYLVGLAVLEREEPTISLEKLELRLRRLRTTSNGKLGSATLS